MDSQRTVSLRGDIKKRKAHWLVTIPSLDYTTIQGDTPEEAAETARAMVEKLLDDEKLVVTLYIPDNRNIYVDVKTYDIDELLAKLRKLSRSRSL